jgi:hypothetical protein
MDGAKIPSAQAKQEVPQGPPKQVVIQIPPDEAPQESTHPSHSHRPHAPRHNASSKPYDETQDIDLSGIK